MCNCGHDELEEAERLRKRMYMALVLVLCLVMVDVGTRSNLTVMGACVGVQAMFLAAAAWLFVRRRTVLCGEAR